jgi:hypothetical protein
VVEQYYPAQAIFGGDSVLNPAGDWLYKISCSRSLLTPCEICDSSSQRFNADAYILFAVHTPHNVNAYDIQMKVASELGANSENNQATSH